MQDAWGSMRKIRKTELQAARDLYYAYVQYVEESKVIQGKTFFSRFTELFTIPRCRTANIAASAVMLAQQLCGIKLWRFTGEFELDEGRQR